MLTHISVKDRQVNCLRSHSQDLNQVCLNSLAMLLYDSNPQPPSPLQILPIQISSLINLTDSLLLPSFLAFIYSIYSTLNLVLFICYALNIKACNSVPSHLYKSPSTTLSLSQGQGNLSLYLFYLPKACHWSLERALSTRVLNHYVARISYFTKQNARCLAWLSPLTI